MSLRQTLHRPLVSISAFRKSLPVLLVICGALGFNPALHGQSVSLGGGVTGTKQASDNAGAASKLQLSYAQMPLSFEPNLGQDASSARFVAHGPGYLLRLDPRDAILELREGRKSAAAKDAGADTRQQEEKHRSLTMELRGAKRNASIVPSEKLRATSSYFTGDENSSKTGIPNYGRVQYDNIYPNIDLDFYGRGNRLEYDFLVGAYADTSKVRLKFKGAEEVRVDGEGNLALHVGGRDVRFLKPVAYQQEIAGGARRPVEVQYTVERGRDSALVSFAVGDYDHGKTLVIDPVLDYATYLSSTYYSVTNVAVDAAGNSYLTTAIPNNYGYSTAFTVVKFDPNGNLLLTATVTTTSGSYAVVPSKIAVSSTGAVYVVGSATPGLPTTSNAYQATNRNSNTTALNVFLAVFQPSGSALSLSYLSYLGGVANGNYGSDYGYGLAVDSSGNAYISGLAQSDGFPTTTGVYQANYLPNTTSAGFVAKFNPSLSGTSSLVYSTLLGGADTVSGSVAVDGSGNAYLASYAPSGFPVTSGALSYAGVDTNTTGVYVTKLNPAATALAYSSYLGPQQGDNYAYRDLAVAVDGSGDAYVTGIAAAQDFPTTAGAYQTSYPGAFVSELNPAGTALIYSTFLGGPSNATSYSTVTPNSLAIPAGCVSACNVYVAGVTSAPDFPAINAIQSYQGANPTAFAVELNGSGSTAIFSTYLGGITSSEAQPYFGYYGYTASPQAALDGAGDLYIAGNLNADTDYPVTASPTAPATPSNAYLAKLGPVNAANVLATPGSYTFSGSIPVGVSSATYYPTTPNTIVLRNMGTQAVTLQPFQLNPPTEFAETDNCNGAIAGGAMCTLNLTFTPTSSGLQSGTLTVLSGTTALATVALSGTGQDIAYVVASAAGLSFADQVVGTSSAAQTVTFTNVGNEPAAISSFYFGQTNSGFTVQNNCQPQLQPSQSCQAAIQFAPYQPGLFQAYLYTSTSSGSNTVALTGQGVVSGTGGSGSLTLTDTALNFNTQLINTASGTQVFYVTNTGTVPVTVNSTTVTLTGTLGKASDFAVTTNSCSTISPQSSCYVYVNFTPSAAGTETATLSINDTTSASPHTVTLSGIGVAATQVLEFLPGNMVFTDQPVGIPSGTQMFYVYSTGTAPVTIDRALVSGDFQLSTDECSGRTITGTTIPGNTGSYCYIYVTFTPTVLGARTGTLTLIDSATGTPQVLNLAGNGIAQTGTLVADPTALVFPAQIKGTTSTEQYVYLSNPGNTPITVNSLTTTGNFAETWPYGSLPYTLSPGASNYYVYVTFTPTTTPATPLTGTLVIGSSAGNQTVSLSGTGVAASQAIGFTPSSVNFGSIVNGTTSYTYPIYVRNTGNEPVTFSVASAITGNFAIQYDYCTYGGSGQQLAAGSSCQINLSFTPVGNGTQTGTLTLTDSAGTQKLTLSGVGAANVSPALAVPSAQAFTQQLVNTSSSPQTITLLNNGLTNLTVTSVKVSTGSANFVIPSGGDSCTGQVLAGAGNSCTITLDFAPTVAGYDTGVVTFATSNGSYTASVAGYALAASDTSYLSPANLVFTQQVVGTTSPSYQQIYFNNTSNGTVTMGTVAGTNYGASSEYWLYNASAAYDYCSGTTLSPGSSCYLLVVFTPSAAGTRSGTLVFPFTYGDGTTGSQTATLTGTGIAQYNRAVVQPSVLAFTDQVVGTTSPSYQQIYLYNNGNAPFTVGSVTGTNYGASSDFWLYSANSAYNSCSGTTVTPGSSCYLLVVFKPSVAGARSGTLNFPVTYYKATSAVNVTATLSGNGIAVGNQPVLSPAAVNFGDQSVGTTSSSYQYIYLTNNGTAAFTVGSVNGTNYGSTKEFWLYSANSAYDSCSGTTVTPGSSCYLLVVFTPSAAGARSGTLVFPVTYPGATSAVNFTATLSGTGIAAASNLVFSQSPVAFGNQPVGTSSSQVQLLLINQSSAAIPITSILVAAGTIPAQFNAADWIESDGCAGGSIGANSYCTINLNFAPTLTSTGARSAKLTATLGFYSLSVTLTGTGTNDSPAVVFYPTSLTFSSQQPVGEGSVVQFFTVTNPGVNNLNITAVASTDAVEFPVTQNGCTGVTLTTGTSCTIGVLFAPSSAASHSATINITDNATGSPQKLTVSGTGVTELTSSVSLTASPASAAYGSLFTLTATVVDQNSKPLTNGRVTFFDGTTALGTVQVVSTTSGGATVGTATLKTILVPLGANSITAKYVGGDVTSTSAATMATVTGQYPSTLSFASAGTAGDYTFTGTLLGAGPVVPTGNVAFNDGTTGFDLGTVALNPATLAQAFVAAPTVTGLSNPQVVAMADLNGDGKPDLVYGTYNNGILVQLGNGDGTFQAPKNFLSGAVPGIAFGDFNGDGKLDIALVTNYSIVVMLGNGDGTFQKEAYYDSGYFKAVAVGDFNGDGILDIVAANDSGNATVDLLLGNGDGTFQEPVSFPVGAPYSLVVGDLNGDGKLDVVVGNGATSDASILLGNGNGTFQAAQTFATQSLPEYMLLADLRGIGKLDLITIEGQNSVGISLGNGNGTFQADQIILTGVGAYNGIAVRDINGDGKLDLAVTNYSTNVVNLLLGNGDGTFQSATSYPTGAGPFGVAFADLNNDGRSDIVVANWSDQTATVLLNQVTQTATLNNAVVPGTGTHPVTGAYAGDTNFVSSTSNTLQLAASLVTPTMQLAGLPAATVAWGQALSVSVNLTGPLSFVPAPTGIVSYAIDGGTTQTATLASGAVTIPLSQLSVGAHSIAVSYGGDGFYTTLAAQSLALTITKASQTISFATLPNVTYGVASSTLSATATSGLAVTFKVNSGPATITSGTLKITGAGTVVVEADQTGNVDYNAATPVTQSFTVATAPLTVTVNSASKVYGTANPAFSGTITGVLNSDAVTATYSSTATAASPVGTYSITATVSGAAAANYTPTVTPGTLTVGKAALTVTATNLSKVYGAANPALTDTITGFVNGDTSAVVTGTASLTTTATAASGVGTYAITAAAGTLAASNYTFTFTPGTLTVSKAALTVTATNLSKIYGAANPALTYAFTGFVNGDTSAVVTGTASLTTTAAPAVGTYAITFSTESLTTSNYSLTYTPGTLTVSKAVLTVMANSTSLAFGLPIPALTGTLTGVVAGDGITASYATTAVQGSPVGPYAITATLNDPNSKLSNYSVTNTPGVLTIIADVLAALTTPTPSSTLSGSGVTFDWTAGGGVTAYKLWLGTTVGSYNLYSSGNVTATSVSVTGLPTYGVPIYATLWSEVNGVFKSAAFTYTEAGTPVLAALTTPTPSSTLSGSSVTFDWTAGGGVTAYKLWLGTTVGSYNLYSSGNTTATSVSVTGLPTYGATIYATLWSQINGVFQSAAYTYTEEKPTPVPAALTTPAPSSTLAGSSVTFDWTKGTGVTAYKLWLGTTAGSLNLYSSGNTTATSVSVTGLPTNGATIYATLWSQINGVFQSAAYTYMEEKPTPVSAALTTPTPSSTLAGSSVTFDWTPGTGVTAYKLWLGTTTGSLNLYSSGNTTATSVTVTGLPTNGATIYATLWSQINGVFQSVSYTYTAAPAP